MRQIRSYEKVILKKINVALNITYEGLTILLVLQNLLLTSFLKLFLNCDLLVSFRFHLALLKASYSSALSVDAVKSGNYMKLNLKILVGNMGLD